MMPPDPKQDAADEWINNLIGKLQLEQDYYIFPGSSKTLRNEKGEQTGISIKRPDVRLYSTGIVKLYEMIVEGKELPDVEYTEEQEKQFLENMKQRFPEVFAEDEETE